MAFPQSRHSAAQTGDTRDSTGATALGLLAKGSAAAVLGGGEDSSLQAASGLARSISDM